MEKRKTDEKTANQAHMNPPALPYRNLEIKINKSYKSCKIGKRCKSRKRQKCQKLQKLQNKQKKAKQTHMKPPAHPFEI